MPTTRHSKKLFIKMKSLKNSNRKWATLCSSTTTSNRKSSLMLLLNNPIWLLSTRRLSSYTQLKTTSMDKSWSTILDGWRSALNLLLTLSTALSKSGLRNTPNISSRTPLLRLTTSVTLFKTSLLELRTFPKPLRLRKKNSTLWRSWSTSVTLRWSLRTLSLVI